MKKFFLLLGLIIILLSGFFLLKRKNEKYLYYQLNGKTYKLLIAKNPLSWQKGLMNVYSKKQINADGMIFIFPNKDYRTFWNQNTFVDLDLYWLDDDQVVKKDFLPSIKKSKDIVYLTSPEKVNRVIEIIR
jgi:LPXTG-motif cell wall-anchored protein